MALFFCGAWSSVVKAVVSVMRATEKSREEKSGTRGKTVHSGTEGGEEAYVIRVDTHSNGAKVFAFLSLWN